MSETAKASPAVAKTEILVPRLEDCLAGGGDMGALMRSIKWERTVFGPVREWPQSLRTALSIMLEARFAMVVAWGPDHRFFYNDRYLPVLGNKHPASLGAPGIEIFPEAWPTMVGPEFDRALRGEAFAVDDWLVPLERAGYLENCYFTLSYSPIRDETGGVGGVLAVVAETTGRVEGERRLTTLRDLARRASDATPEDACLNAGAVFAQNPIDVPFASLYVLDHEGQEARRVCLQGMPDDYPLAAPVIQLKGEHETEGQRVLADAIALGTTQVLDDLAQRFGAVPGGPYPEAVKTALLIPLSRPGLPHPYGLLVAGVSPRRALDDRYRGFFDLAADHIATGLQNAHAFAEQRARADVLAQLDRAKTAFFSNVSHEFRTPLTLMLGPLEELLAGAHGPLAPAVDQQSRMIYRNASRLLKLVNSLLDFARIEAGRAEASFQPVDLAAVTAQLAGMFRSAVERAGLQFTVDCPELPERIYVDPDMWEKVVLNLLSNAFKFTFEGEIAVRLRLVDDRVQLEVRDSGVGIPPAELPNVFQRFHRVRDTRSRTHEGTGIGLALVQELVRLHGGTIAVSSAEGDGTVFTVSLRTGSDHLPAERIAKPRTISSTAIGAAPFVDEAMRWLDTEPLVSDELGSSDASGVTPMPPAETGRARILVADDNADMREYLQRVLGRWWKVELVANGADALKAARRTRPDLVVTDVMMPEMDGFQLLQALRADPALESIPVMMLSARAGEESRIEGLTAGADDYLVKPFSARELVARVGSHLALALARGEIEQHRQRLYDLFMQAPVPICVFRGTDLVFEMANREYLGVTARPDLIGRTLLEAMPEVRGQNYDEMLRSVLETGVPVVRYDSLLRLSRPPGPVTDTYWTFIYAPLRNAAGVVDRVMALAHEVTDQVQARQVTDRLRVDAEAANRAKDEFLAMLGHELRNPLAPIVTALHLMKFRPGAEGVEPDRALIERQVEHLTRLVDDLLDVSRIASGRIELQQEPMEIARALAKAVEMAGPLLEQRRQRLRVDAPPQGMLVMGDEHRLAQVFSNILTNAAKYSDPDSIIEITTTLDTDGVTVATRDQGIGIPAELLPRVFELFTQGGRSDRAEGGLGLGLAIVRNLVQLHGGSVEAASDGPGRGSVFTVRLPRAQQQDATRRSPGRARENRVAKATRERVLVVDDNRAAADTLVDLLQLYGFDCRAVYDGPSALRKAQEFDAEIAILDIGLPGMDGYDVAEQLRRRQGASPIRLVALSGYTQELSHRRAGKEWREVFDGYLVKPVDVRKLLALIGVLSSHPTPLP